jgi:hypothetical protein
MLLLDDVPPKTDLHQQRDNVADTRQSFLQHAGAKIQTTCVPNAQDFLRHNFPQQSARCEHKRQGAGPTHRNIAGHNQTPDKS